MERVYTLLFLVFIASNLHSQQSETSQIKCKDFSYLLESEAHAHESKLSFRTNVLTKNYDLTYHRLEWEIDPAEYYIKGKITSYFIPTEGSFQQLNFDLSASLTINGIYYHEDSLSYTLNEDDNLQINLPKMIPTGQLDSITIDYEGEPRDTGFRPFTISTHSGIPVLWTLSEPFGAKEWWPCKQDLNDKIDSIDVIVRTPSDYRVASNGVLISELEEGTEKIYHWKHRYPIPAYLIAIAVTNYAVYSDYVPLENGDSLEILNYVYPENLNTFRPQTKESVEMMGLFNDLFGIYPFANEKYGHAQFGWGGGMEHQTMSFMVSFPYFLQAHELAHQWFGDKITCGSWQDIWLNEGFATYLTGLTAEFIDESTDWMDWKRGVINDVVSQPGGSVWVNDTTNVQRIFNGRLSYHKGAMLLHMLRWTIGEEQFFQAVRNYLEDPDLAYGYAKTDDLKAHLENESGLDLTEFFNDWYYNQGYPSFHISWSSIDNLIRIKIDQITSHTSVDFFEMVVPILVSGQGQDSLLRLDHSYSGEEFEIELPFNADTIVFDPDLWLVSAENTTEMQVISTVQDHDFQQAISVSPNPVANILSIQINQSHSIDRMEIVDVHGRIIDRLTPNRRNFTITTDSWIPGSYFLIFHSGTLKTNKLIIKP